MAVWGVKGGAERFGEHLGQVGLTRGGSLDSRANGAVGQESQGSA